MKLLVCAALAFVCAAQDRSPALAEIFTFERLPIAWGAYPAGDVHIDEQIVHGGKRAVRIERQADSAQKFSGINRYVPIDFDGQFVEFRGFVRTQDVTGFVSLWMREDGENPQAGNVAFATTQGLGVKGTTDWTEYSISVPLKPEGKRIYFGFILGGEGKAWGDDFQLLVDGKPIWEVPKGSKAQTPLDTDHEFDAGSKIVLTDLGKQQIENLATLGKVWGFLKYHHPAVAGGKRHWDYDLFRILPDVLKAPDRATANAAMAKWIASLGEVPKCGKCATLADAGLHLKPPTVWIRDEVALGPDLTRALDSVYRNRISGKQFYLSQMPGVGNPVFENESAYPGRVPDAGYQLLALYRYWNIIQYWFPYRDIIGEDWDKVLPEFIPKIALAKTADDYKLQFLTLIARVHDTHANLWGSLAVRPPVGTCQVPVVVRFVEDRAVITGHFDPESPRQPQLQRGDVIDAIDGAPVAELVKQWQPYYAASNHPTALRDMARTLTVGSCGEVKLTIRRGADKLDVAASRVTGPAPQSAMTHDIPGEAFRLLSKDVAYIKIGALKSADVPKYIDSAAGTKGLVIDIRNYPSDFPIFPLGGALVKKETPFATFTAGDPANPGAFHFNPAPIALPPTKPHYAGKVVILVDEVSQSSAEYHSMAFRATPNAIVVGSTTAGADGNVSQIPLPGGLRSMISGIGVFYPDKRPTQRVGIVPDKEAKPTIAGIKAGRDEVLEAALREILGPEVSAAEIETISKAGRN
jgi:C-terminal processing protease CtpA/Prc